MHNRNFEVYISCDGQRLPEYKVTKDDEKTSSCFIPSEAGKSFKLCWNSHDPMNTLDIVCKIDGRYMGGSPCRPGASGSRWGVRAALAVRQPFQFSNIVLSEDDDLMVSDQTLQNLGTIKVELTRIHPIFTPAVFKTPNVLDIGVINERSKKAGSHCVSLGQPQACSPCSMVSTQPLHPGEGIWATFIFRYRPQAILQAQGMLPTSSHAGSSNLKREGTSSGSKHSSKRKRHSAQPSHPNQNMPRGTPLSTDIKILPSQAKNPQDFQQGKGKSTSLIPGNVPSSSRKRAKTEPTSPKGRPSVDVEVIDLTGIKREGSPIRVKFAKGETIDLTLEPDSD